MLGEDAALVQELERDELRDGAVDVLLGLAERGEEGSRELRAEHGGALERPLERFRQAIDARRQKVVRSAPAARRAPVSPPRT